jgi:hypothetical protein
LVDVTRLGERDRDRSEMRDEGGASWREHDVRKYHQAAVRINIDSYMDKRLRFGAESMPDAGHNMQHAPPTTPAAVTYQLTTAID